jgi:hypothetical protein
MSSAPPTTVVAAPAPAPVVTAPVAPPPATVVTTTPPPATVVVAPPPAAVITPPPTGPTKRYDGLVWTWDKERNIVTFYDYGTAKTFRVLTTPDQIARLRLHENGAVTGQLLAPDNLGSTVVAAGPMTPVASGAASTADITGQVTAIDTNGVASINSARGPLRVWVAEGAQNRFSTSRPVTVHVVVQPVRMVAVSGVGGQASGPTMAMAPSMPGDSAVAVGRVLGVSPTGALTIESSRGPISVWVPDAANFRIGDFVQVNTIVASN